ncbi:MAG: helix-turn-helix domain-containing protein [Christensenella sp.]
MENFSSRVYTVEEVAKMLNMKSRTAYAFCETTDKFQVERVGQRGLRINKASFDAWMPHSRDSTKT